MPWDPTEWISQGRTYEDVPLHVQMARRHILQIPDLIQSLLPAKTMLISRLLLSDLPPMASYDESTYSGLNSYTTKEPTKNIEELLPFLALPTRPILRNITDKFGQAWFDGNKSICTSVNPELAYPLWILTYWAEMVDVSEAKDTWLHAETWLNKTGKIKLESDLKLAVRGLWSVVGWHGSVHGFANLPTSYMAKLFSEDYLDGRIIDAMLTLLSLRARISGEETLIVGTTFADYIRSLPPVEDGIPAGQIVSTALEKYLKKYGTFFQDSAHKKLYTVLHRPPEHWTTTLVNFEAKAIKYGDGLKWSRPEDFLESLQTWIQEYHGAPFGVSDLTCARQTDRFNCPIIAVNMIGHNEFGDALWTSETAKAMHMQTFCDLLKYALSAKVRLFR
ncbi:hypothetical protein C8R44DRAFT_881016 [Mycena epipterygia]|nr:hypothetical protein C8R44DRAFT_881016 [Mycena epipterygia]